MMSASMPLSMNHSPMAAPEGRQILVGGGIRGGCRHEDGKGHGPLLFQHTDNARDVRLLLSDGNVDGIKRPVLLVAGSLGGPVQAGLVDDGIHTNGGFASRSVAADQFTLTAANRDHGINSHNAGLHRLTDGSALDDAWGNFFDWISGFALDWAFAIDRLAKSIDDAAEQGFSRRHLEELAGGADLLAFLYAGVLAQDDCAYLGLFKIERQPGDAVSEVDHLIEHRVSQALNLGYAIADFADDAHILLGGRGFYPRNLGFNLLQ